MSEPQTYNEVMAWFGTGHHAGRFDLHGISILLKESKLSPPNQMWDWIISHRLMLHEPQECWITPKGKVWGVSYGIHEFLLTYPMERLSTETVERAGWLRVSRSSALIRTKATRQQLDVLAVLRPDLTPRLPYGDVIRRKRDVQCDRFDFTPLKTPWTVWLPEYDAKPEGDVEWVMRM